MKDGKSKRGLWAEGLEHREPLWQERLAPLRAEGHQQETNHILSRNFRLVSARPRPRECAGLLHLPRLATRLPHSRSKETFW